MDIKQRLSKALEKDYPDTITLCTEHFRAVLENIEIYHKEPFYKLDDYITIIYYNNKSIRILPGKIEDDYIYQKLPELLLES